MRKSLRAVGFLGLGAVGLAVLGTPALGQQEGAAAKAAAAAVTPMPTNVHIGSIDMDRVFKDYKRVKNESERLKTEALAKQGELQKLMNQLRQLATELDALAPGSKDFKEKQTEATKLKAELEAEREQAQGEFARREAEALATIYKEVQMITAAVAKQRGFTFVVKVSNESVTGNDPNSVMAAMARSVVYYDPSTDLTTTVVGYLNQRYDAAVGAQGGAATTGSTAAPATGDAATKPAAATATRPSAAAATRR